MTSLCRRTKEWLIENDPEIFDTTSYKKFLPKFEKTLNEFIDYENKKKEEKDDFDD